MNKHLTDAEINLAREIFLRTMQPVKTQDFNQQMAECSIRLARLFTAAVCEENRHCNHVEIDPIYTGISVEQMKKDFDSALQGELAVKYPDAPRFDEMVSGFAKFDLYAEGHNTKYEKIETKSFGTITCSYHVGDLADKYIEHTYPDWVVAKYTDKFGTIWGSDRSDLVFNDGMWMPSDMSGVQKMCILSYEKCLVAPENSLVSIGLPF